MNPPPTAAADTLALWQQIRDRHAQRPQPYAVHYAEGCRWCDSEGCWLDDYAQSILTDFAPKPGEVER